MTWAPVVVSSAGEERVRPYVEALVAAGVPAAAIRIVTPAGLVDVPDAADVVPTPASGGSGETWTTDSSRMPAAATQAAAAAAMEGAAGLVLCGGCDVAPQLYGETPLAGAGLSLLPARDALEWELLLVARARRLPVWGVCRGFQLLNVFFGGSLWQDLALQRPSAVAHEAVQPLDLLSHPVQVIAPDAPLGDRLADGGAPLLVNSRHHQGVKRLGAGLQAVAAAPDGLIEAAILAAPPNAPAPDTGSAGASGAKGGDDGGSRGAGRRSGDTGDDQTDAGGWWVRGVEWHPENLLDLPQHLALWRDFAAAALAASAARVAGTGTGHAVAAALPGGAAEAPTGVAAAPTAA
jgi:gamma-glutamyl-gamma-aminobutyrate hydrolase PuuD